MKCKDSAFSWFGKFAAGFLLLALGIYLFAALLGVLFNDPLKVNKPPKHPERINYFWECRVATNAPMWINQWVGRAESEELCGEKP